MAPPLLTGLSQDHGRSRILLQQRTARESEGRGRGEEGGCFWKASGLDGRTLAAVIIEGEGKQTTMKETHIV